MRNERQKRIDDAYNRAIEVGNWDNQNELFIPIKDVKNEVEQIDNYYDKIVLAQMAYDRQTCQELIKNIKLTENQRKKYLELKSKNTEVDKTLNFEILGDKYSFLDEEMLIMFTREIGIQQRLISLNDERLEIFKMLYKKIMLEVSNPIPIISQVLYSMGTCPDEIMWKDRASDELNECFEPFNKQLEEKVKKGEKLTDQDLDKLLFIYNYKAFDIEVDVETLEDMYNIGTENTIGLQESYEVFKEHKSGKTKSIDELKNKLLYLSYGIDLPFAKRLVEKYSIKGIEVSSNSDIFKLYYSIYKIVEEQNIEKLMKIFEELKERVQPSFDYRIPYLIEQELKDFYLEQYNLSTYKTKENEVAMEQDGIKIYDAGTDFNMIIHCVGAYFGKDREENYEQEWNVPKLSRNSLSCSFINNSNLSTAMVKSVIYGFESFEKGSLVGLLNDDLATTEYDRYFSIDRYAGSNFCLPKELIDLTRGLYNELQLERRDLSKQKEKYKKQPDYIVFIEEFEDEDIENLDEQKINLEPDKEKRELLMEQKRLWEESKKAAKQFSKVNENGEKRPLPIVKINREKCAISEVEKIVQELELYEKEKDINKIYNIITRFANNSTGNRSPHEFIRNKYFSEEFINQIIDRIIGSIKEMPNIQDKKDHIKRLSIILNGEIDKKLHAKNTWLANVTNGIGKQHISKVAEVEKELMMEGR